MVTAIVLTSVGLDPMVVAVLRGLAAGNILYVTFYELLTREVRSRALGLLSHFLALIGFLLMLAVQLFGGTDDGSIVRFVLSWQHVSILTTPRNFGYRARVTAHPLRLLPTLLCSSSS